MRTPWTTLVSPVTMDTTRCLWTSGGLVVRSVTRPLNSERVPGFMGSQVLSTFGLPGKFPALKSGRDPGPQSVAEAAGAAARAEPGGTVTGRGGPVPASAAAGREK